MIALSNGNISLFDNNKNKSKPKKITNKEPSTDLKRQRKVLKEKPKKINKSKKVRKSKSDMLGNNDLFKFDMNDISKGLKFMDLSDEDLERGMEIITRTKKYMTRDERKVLVKLESMLDLVRGIKKLSGVDDEVEAETNFFRSMDEEDKKNMMIKEILEVFPEKRKESIEKAIDMKKKIDLFAELFLPDDFGEGGFSLSSLANINNLGSASNLKLLGSLLRGSGSGYEEYEEDDNDEYEPEDDEIYEEYEDEEYEYYEEDDDYEEDDKK